jgi:peptide deformylase
MSTQGISSNSSPVSSSAHPLPINSCYIDQDLEKAIGLIYTLENSMNMQAVMVDSYGFAVGYLARLIDFISTAITGFSSLESNFNTLFTNERLLNPKTLAILAQNPERYKKIKDYLSGIHQHMYTKLANQKTHAEKNIQQLSEQILKSASQINSSIAQEILSSILLYAPIEHPNELNSKNLALNILSYLPQQQSPLYPLGKQGLYNLGNTCFANASWQVLFHIPQLLAKFLYVNEDQLKITDTYSYDHMKEVLSKANLPLQKNNEDLATHKRKCEIIQALRSLYLCYFKPYHGPDIAREDIYDNLSQLYTLINDHPLNANIILGKSQHDAHEFIQLLANLLDLDSSYGITLGDEYISTHQEKGSNPQARNEFFLSTGYFPETLPENISKTLQNLLNYTFAYNIDPPDLPLKDKNHRKYGLPYDEFTQSHREYLFIKNTKEIPQSILFHIQRYKNDGSKDLSSIEDFDKEVSLVFTDETNNHYVQKFIPAGFICHEGESVQHGHYTALVMHNNEYAFYNDAQSVQKWNLLTEDARKYFQDTVYIVHLEKKGDPQLLQPNDPLFQIPEKINKISSHSSPVPPIPNITKHGFINFFKKLFSPLIELINYMIHFFTYLYHIIFPWSTSSNPLPLLVYGNTLLKKKCALVSKFDEELKNTAYQMIDKMKELKGIGLAANQVGIDKQIFVIRPYKNNIRDTQEFEEAKIYINPEIIVKDPTISIDMESCLSIPEFSLEIPRPTQIYIKAKNENGYFFEEEVEGLKARQILHEYDHLQGLYFTDRINSKELEQKLIPQHQTKQQEINSSQLDDETKKKLQEDLKNKPLSLLLQDTMKKLQPQVEEEIKNNS